MAYQLIRVETLDDLAILTLNDPATLNAASLPMVDEILEALATIELGDVPARALLITGTGRGFCSGANLAEGKGAAAVDGDGRPDAGRPLETHYNALVARMRDFPLPIVTAVNGPAAGFGASLALMGDIIIASVSAYFVQSFKRIGLVPDGGATYQLARAVGRPRAMEMVLLGERISAQQAGDWGLINRCVPDDAMLAVAVDIANRIATGPKSMALTRNLVWQGLDASWSEQLWNERAAQRMAGKTDDALEGKRSFREKRDPVFVGQ